MKKRTLILALWSLNFTPVLSNAQPPAVTNHAPDDAHQRYEYYGFTPSEKRAWEEKHKESLAEDKARAQRYAALAVHIERMDERLVAYGNDCSQLQNALELVGIWKKELEPGWTPPPMKDCTFNAELKRFELEAVAWLPAHPKAHLGVKNLCGGFNCVNTALNSTGLVADTRYSGQSFYESVMTSPLCERITDRTKLRPGDIVTVGSNPSQRVRPSHAFIYVSPHLAYEKPDNGTSVTRFNDSSDILANWNVAPDCFPNGLEKKECSENRNRWAVAHRCKAQPLAIPEKLQPYLQRAEEFEKRAAPWLRQALPRDPEQFQKDLAPLRALELEFDKLMEQEKIRERPKAEAMAWWFLSDKIGGVYSQHLSAEGYACWDWFCEGAMKIPLRDAMEQFVAYEKRGRELDLQIGSSQSHPHVSLMVRRILKNPETDLPIVLEYLKKDWTTWDALKVALELEPEKMRAELTRHLAKYPELKSVLEPTPAKP